MMRSPKSITLEDTFHDYGISVWRYYDTDEDYWDIIGDEGKIQAQQMISKTKIGTVTIRPKTVFENLQIKHYIRIGEECPVCYEPIHHKNDAYLTNCGHAFHYKCIIEYEYHNMKQGNYLGMNCPMCRQDMGYYPELKNKFFNKCNNLDRLEDFNNNIKINNPVMCLICNRAYGCNPKCHICNCFHL